MIFSLGITESPAWWFSGPGNYCVIIFHLTLLWTLGVEGVSHQEGGEQVWRDSRWDGEFPVLPTLETGSHRWHPPLSSGATSARGLELG